MDDGDRGHSSSCAHLLSNCDYVAFLIQIQRSWVTRSVVYLFFFMDLSWENLLVDAGVKRVKFNTRLNRVRRPADNPEITPEMPCTPRTTYFHRVGDTITPAKTTIRKHKKRARSTPVDTDDGDGLTPSPTKKRKTIQTDFDARIRVGTDCGGLSAEVHAIELLELGHRADHVFTSESDPKTRMMTLLNNPGVRKVFNSCLVKDRPLSSVPKSDMYIAGSPCQDFSLVGARKDTGKLEVFEACIKYIGERRPRTFILENVANLRNNRSLYDKTLSDLRNIKVRSGKSFYRVGSRVLDSAEYTAIPHKRERLYIVGVQATTMSEDEDFEWPSKVRMMKLSAFLAPNRTKPCFVGLNNHVLQQIVNQMCELKKTGVDPRRVLYVSDPQASERFQGKPLLEMSYTLTRTRCPGGGYFMTSWGRFMTTEEMIKLFGFKPSCIKRSACTEREFRQMLGNSMSVPMIASLIRMVLVATKLVDPLVVPDPLSCGVPR